MRAWIFHGPGDLRLEDVPETQPGPGEVKIAVKAAATCGTDLKTYRRGHPTIPVTPSPFGHEPAGQVIAVGEGVTGFKEGDRVVCANTVPCGHCFYCSIDRESLCPNLEFLYGAFADELIIPASIVRRNTYHIPSHLSYASVAPLEPLATVCHGIDQSGIRLGDTVVVNGAGPVGQMHTRLASARGAHVISVDRYAWRLDQAKAAGAIATVNIDGIDDPDEVVAMIKAHTPQHRGADVAIEAVGLAVVWEQTWKVLRPGGVAIMFGGTPANEMMQLNTSVMHYQEIEIKGIFHHTPRYVRMAVDMLASGIVDGNALITEIRPLDALIDSLEDMAQGKGSKYALVPDHART